MNNVTCPYCNKIVSAECNDLKDHLDQCAHGPSEILGRRLDTTLGKLRAVERAVEAHGIDLCNEDRPLATVIKNCLAPIYPRPIIK